MVLEAIDLRCMRHCLIAVILSILTVSFSQPTWAEGGDDGNVPTTARLHHHPGYQSLPSNECDVGPSQNATNPCPTGGTSNAIGNGSPNPGIIAARSLAATNDIGTAIDAFSYCRYINNSSANSLFLPFNTASPEWLGFISNTPAQVILSDCSRGGQVPVPPNFGSTDQTNQCVGAPVPPDQKVTAPYAVWSAANPPTWTTPSPVNFPDCTSPDGTAFFESAIATLAGVDSGYGPSNTAGWNVSSVAYTYNGECGSAINDPPSQTAPTNDLCHVGPNTAVYLNTNANPKVWAWTCQQGNGGGTLANCTAPYQGSTVGVCGTTLWNCSIGTPVNEADSGSTSTWNCQGPNGGGLSPQCLICDSGYQLVNGTCQSIGNCPQWNPNTNCDRSLPADPNGTVCNLDCFCGRQRPEYQFTCINGTWHQTGFQDKPCFLGDVTITLADGSVKAMTELKPGDVVRGKKRNNTVLSVPSHIHPDAIYGFNGAKPFVTGGHPFWTKDGWKAIDPALTHLPEENHDVVVTKLQVGDALWLSDGTKLKIKSIDAHDLGPQPVYNPAVDGDHTYYANGLLVHNYQQGCPYSVSLSCP